MCCDNIPPNVSDELLEGGHRAQKPSSVPPVRLRVQNQVTKCSQAAGHQVLHPMVLQVSHPWVLQGGRWGLA